MSFTRRRINLRFQLGTGSFGGDGNDTVDFTGLRCSANITKAGGQSLAALDLNVYGMTLDTMNKLTVLNVLQYTNGRKNTVTVSAGSDDSGMAVAFVGDIIDAWADLHSPPEGVFHVTAYTGSTDGLKPVPPTSFNGSVDVATVLSGIAAQMTPPRTFENTGVSVQIADPYLAGTLLDQAKRVALAANIYMTLDDLTLAIWPKNGTRGGQVVEVSPETGLVGYPAFTQNSIMLQTLYNANITVGQRVKVTSALEQANGEFVVFKVTHNLDAETPGGPWFTHAECGLPGQEAPIPS